MTQTMTQRSLTSLALAFLFVLGFAPATQAQVGGAAVVFLQIEPDSRAAGMGNAGVALADNAYSVFWNPAGLAYQQGTEISLTHSNWLPEFNAGLFYEYLVAKHHVPGLGTFAGQVTFLNLGEHECRNEQNDPCGTFKSYDLAVGASYGFNITPQFALGSSLRLIYSNLAPQQSVSAQETKAGVSVGFDLAGLYRTRPIQLGGVGTTLSAGFNLANMGPKIQYSDSEQSDPIPTNLRMGVASTFQFDEFNQVTLAYDANKMLINVEVNEETNESEADEWYQAVFSSWGSVDVCETTQGECLEDPALYRSLGALQQLTHGVGLEYWYGAPKLFAIRAGYFYENPFNGNREFLTFGAGIKYNIVGVDFSYIYALEENHPLSDTMRFSLLLNLR